MNHRSLHRAIFMVCAAAILLSGCRTTRQTRSVETSGFLGDYSMLREGEGKEAQLVYAKPGLNLAGYTKVIIDPIVIMRPADSAIAKLPPEEIQALADHLYLSLATELEQDYEIVQQPGPDVLRIRAAITEARGSRVAMDMVTSLIPQTRTLSTVGGLATDTSLFVGKAGVEAEIVDSRGGERLLAAVDERVGTKALRGSLSTWNDVKESYDYWARRLRERLAELSGASEAR